MYLLLVGATCQYHLRTSILQATFKSHGAFRDHAVQEHLRESQLGAAEQKHLRAPLRRLSGAAAASRWQSSAGRRGEHEVKSCALSASRDQLCAHFSDNVWQDSWLLLLEQWHPAPPSSLSVTPPPATCGRRCAASDSRIRSGPAVRKPHERVLWSNNMSRGDCARCTVKGKSMLRHTTFNSDDARAAWGQD